VISSPPLLGLDTSAVAATNSPVLLLYAEANVSGDFSPTTRAGAPALDTGEHILDLSAIEQLAARGYLAVRVPHAPPSYTQSALIPAIPPQEPDALVFTYYSPPDSATPTSVAISVTRRVDLEQAVNQRYPITDGKAHWEVWWLPQGASLPIPAQAFRLGPKSPSHPHTFELRFRLDFGDASAAACAGCRLQVLLFTGYSFVDVYDQPLYIEVLPVPPSSPPFGWGVLCGAATAGQNAVPGGHVVMTQWLQNYVNASRSFTITASSSEGWTYRYFYRNGPSGSLIAVPGLPFTVTAGPAANFYTPGCVGIMATYSTPPTMTTDVCETWTITATSRISPSLQVATHSWALGEHCPLNTGAHLVYLPIVLFDYDQ
jgi:hypothetical protein